MKSPMKSGKYVAYYRVSTDRQGQSGLGLEAQRAAVMSYLNGGKWDLISEHTEVLSGKRDDRPELKKALDLCKRAGATLIVAKMDRLGRRASFVLNMLDNSGVNFVFVEMPHASTLEIGIRAVVAQEEGRVISARTKAAIAISRENRGVKWGTFGKELARRNKAAAQENAHSLAPTVAEIRAAGHTTVRAITEQLNARGIPSPRGARWHIPAVHRLIKNMDRRTRRPAHSKTK